MKDSNASSGLVPLPCACANLRRASRAVTQLYDSMLRRSGLKTTQFTVLKAIAEQGPVRHSVLGDLLALDSTTLTRNLGPLRSSGWVEVTPGADRRERLVRLTPAGRRILIGAERDWKAAQQRLRRLVGDDDWEALAQLTRRVAALAKQG